MAQYVMLCNWTDQGIRNAKDTVKRLAAAKAAYKKAGAKILSSYWTLGSYDMVITAEAPSDEVITALGLQLGMLGNIRSTTLRAYDETEIAAILKKV